MKPTSAATKAAWLSGDYTGTRRAMARVTVQKLNIALIKYDVAANQVTSEAAKDRSGKYAAANFGQLHRPLELPNLKSIRWNRSVDEPVATATLEFYNTAPLPMGEAPARPYEFDQPGYYTFNRGMTSYSTSRFGHTATGWQNLLVPDRILRTWEGYGYDPTLPPETDPHMNPSGVWMIDDVQYTSDGLITVNARDFGRLLTDHICFPPVVPWAEYPLYWDAYHQVKNPPIIETSQSSNWARPAYHSDSNIAWVGNGAMHGHHGRDAFDNNADTYFLSVGNINPKEPFAYEYVQGSVSAPVSAVRLHAYAGPYTVYVSVMVGGQWQGQQVIPYNQKNIGRNKTDIPFVASQTVGSNGVVEIRLPQAYEGAQYVRVTLGNLWNSGIGPYVYRGAIRGVEVLYSSTVTTITDGGTHTEGNYTDYTDIVKWFLAWGGFYWPEGGPTSRAFLTHSDGTREYLMPAVNDPLFAKGRVWGDLQQSGTSNAIIDVNGTDGTGGQISVKLDIDIWDKQPLLDCIGYIRDILNYVFYIDEQGGAVFRPPNIWSVGNYVSSPTGGPRTGRTTEIVEIDEKQTLVSLTAALSSRNVRERVFVGNVPGNVAAIAGGFNPYPSGMRRVGGWTDQRFVSEAECQRMADLITLRQMFTYRENQLTIPANPAIQCDDQVRIYESVTNEGYIHYVKSIESQWDIETGEWVYSLTTHWLGESPFDRWAFNPYDPNQLSTTTLDYLRAVGLVP